MTPETFRSSDLGFAVEALSITFHDFCVDRNVDPGDMAETVGCDLYGFALKGDTARVGLCLGILSQWLDGRFTVAESLARRMEAVLNEL